ncbi:hypothetical protein [Halobacillus sp. BBL2006]|uniref:hypothetical protein n=1 Tax=Halobacillus sp. BBL2006 TaxID=1543706 RepID=UPI000543B56C|nr:hypothetical protein [Halobacillus sp. BBL2006]KHE67946.1 hypothetical protein LD39_15635 [Halobacillus sp. BBL2006]
MFLQWVDWITPTSPLASFFFGVLFTTILGITIWFETKQPKMVFIAALTGIAVTFIGVSILTFLGYYT